MGYEHTPLPWRNKETYHGSIIENKKGVPLFDLHYGDRDEHYAIYGQPMTNADAEFCVKAANVHYHLLSAIEAIVDEYSVKGEVGYNLIENARKCLSMESSYNGAFVLEKYGEKFREMKQPPCGEWSEELKNYRSTSF